MATFNLSINNAESFTPEAFSSVALSKFNAWKARQENDETVVAAAVNSVFDDHVGARLNFECIRSEVLAKKLNTPPGAFKEMGKRVHAYLKAHSAAKETDRTPSGNAPLFIGGKKTGTKRISDIPVPAVPTV